MTVHKNIDLLNLMSSLAWISFTTIAIPKNLSTLQLFAGAFIATSLDKYIKVFNNKSLDIIKDIRNSDKNSSELRREIYSNLDNEHFKKIIEEATKQLQQQKYNDQVESIKQQGLNVNAKIPGLQNRLLKFSPERLEELVNANIGKICDSETNRKEIMGIMQDIAEKEGLNSKKTFYGSNLLLMFSMLGFSIYSGRKAYNAGTSILSTDVLHTFLGACGALASAVNIYMYYSVVKNMENDIADNLSTEAAAQQM